MRDHKDFIIDKLIDGIAEAFVDACCYYSNENVAEPIECLSTDLFIDNYISSLPGQAGFIDTTYHKLIESYDTKEISVTEFRNFFRAQIKMHIREQIRAMGDGKVGGDIGGY